MEASMTHQLGGHQCEWSFKAIHTGAPRNRIPTLTLRSRRKEQGPNEKEKENFRGSGFKKRGRTGRREGKGREGKQKGRGWPGGPPPSLTGRAETERRKEKG